MINAYLLDHSDFIILFCGAPPLPHPHFSFYLLGDIDYVTISLFNKRPRSKDVHVAQITVHLKELDNGELIEEWFQLSPVSPQMKGDMGSVRVKVRENGRCNVDYVFSLLSILIIDHQASSNHS